MPTFFATAADFGAWLAAHHASTPALVVGFHKRDSGLPSMTWPEAVDEALCVGWIDGVRTSLGAQSYQIRFTPRRPGSIWSAVNIAKYEALAKAGRVNEAGQAAWAHRREAKSKVYAYEQAQAAELSPADQDLFRQQAAAWQWFQNQAPSWKHKVAYWIAQAARPDTRAKRLALLIEAATQGRRV